MKCPYCGYENPDDQTKCLFCGAENTEAARRHQKDVIHTLEEEGRQTAAYPEQVLKEANQKAAGIGARILAGAVLLILLVVIGSLGWHVYKAFSRTRNLARLSQYLQSGDYDSLAGLLSRIDDYDSSYKPYLEVYDVYMDMDYLDEELEWFYEAQASPYYTDEIRTEYLAYGISDCMNAIRDADQYLKDDHIRGNEDALTELYQEVYNTLTLTYLMSEEEIQEMLDISGDNEYFYYTDEDVLPYAVLSLKRMN